jgi:hypothetical protein
MYTMRCFRTAPRPHLLQPYRPGRVLQHREACGDALHRYSRTFHYTFDALVLHVQVCRLTIVVIPNDRWAWVYRTSRHVVIQCLLRRKNLSMSSRVQCMYVCICYGVTDFLLPLMN